MDFEFWWLLSWPLFFVMGWLAARIDIKHVIAEARSLPRSYLTGLNNLLAEKPDKAIDAFLEAVQVDPQTVELHFVLGHLFRRRGEVDRAIRIHQSLIDRDDIEAGQRLQALNELGEDYRKAGLLDRAEAVYLQLRDTDRDEVAKEALLQIYQQEKNWLKAIEIARAMPADNSHRWDSVIANFYCEIAAAALALSRFDEVREQIGLALACNRKCVRANILLGDSYAAQSQDDKAIEAWQQVGLQDAGYMALVAERLILAYRRLNSEEKGIQLLRSYLEQTPSLDLMDVVFNWEMKKNGADAAYALVRDQLKRNPTLLGLEKLLEAAIHTAPVEKSMDIELIRGMIHGHTRKVARYCCNECGFKARQFYWHCPACGGWETYPPRRTEEFDLTL
ncbi:lipopolysaccharide assembly protein LapB [Uliginosibacterium gangwonense]|uniref:lipopolysaccharide assembly protein LapB n=1 Tax=Uliginosibacterium gangwonense TaxID=392736 RepID=UPI000368137A|nr:lipopolysaccharide assembly protein LapB [Uliginosibacterium gangwonense]